MLQPLGMVHISFPGSLDKEVMVLPQRGMNWGLSTLICQTTLVTCWEDVYTCICIFNTHSMHHVLALF